MYPELIFFAIAVIGAWEVFKALIVRIVRLAGRASMAGPQSRRRDRLPL